MVEKTFLPVLIFSALVLLGARWMPRWALRRPALLGVISVGLALWGLLSLRSLPVELMPEAAAQTVTVTVNVRGGMAPSDVETLIARPLEEALGDLPRLKDLLAHAKKDRCITSLTFEPGADMKKVTAQVHERMERAMPRLPPEIEKPVVARYEESDAPVFIAAFTSPSLSPEAMRRLIEEKVKDRLLRAPGAANVEIGGGRERKILVEADRDKLLAHRVPLQKIVTALGRRNVATRAGALEGARTSASIRFVGTFGSVDEMKRLVVARSPGGATIFLENLATVQDAFMEPESLSRLNGRAAVSIYVQKESAANAMRTGRGVEEALEKAWRDLPPAARAAMEKIVVSNQADAIEKAVSSLRMSLATGVLLIVLVLCLFQNEAARPVTKKAAGAALLLTVGALTAASLLKMDAAGLEVPLWALLALFTAWAARNRDLRPAFVVAGTIPMSILFSFILFKLCGVSLNIMSFFGVALGIGMLVDNGIVVLESVQEKGPARAEEAAAGVVMPLVGATVVNAIVFAPFLFLSEELRALYIDVAVAVTAALFGSVAVALTAGVALGAKVSAESREGKDAGWETALEAFLDRIIARFNGPAEAAKSLAVRAVRRAKDLPPLPHFPGWCLPLLFLAAFGALWAAGGPGAAKTFFALGAAGAAGAGFHFFRRYGADWRQVLRRRFLVLGWAAALSAAAVAALLKGTEMDLTPAAEADEFVIFVELSSGARLQVSDDVVKEIERRVMDESPTPTRLSRAAARVAESLGALHPALKRPAAWATAVFGGPSTASCVKTLVSRVEGWSSKVYVTLKPREHRSLSAEKVVALLRERLQDVGLDRDGNAFIHFSSPRAGSEVSVQVFGPDYAGLEELARRLTAEMSKVKGLSDVKMRYRPGRPELWVQVDPVRAAVHGVTPEDAAETAHALMRGLRATTFRSGGEQVETIVRLRAQDRDKLSSLPDLPLFNRATPQLRLGNVASMNLTKMPNEISRRNRERLIEVTANRDGVSLGRAAAEMQRIIDGMKFPLDYYAALDASYEEASRGMSQLLWGVGAMTALIYLVLVLLFESMVLPLVIMTTVPLCVIGAAWGLTLFRTPLTTGVLVGVMMLGGIVVNNALMLLDKFNASPPPPGDAEALAEALFGAARARMRPIFLTAGAAVLDFLPMMLDASESGALWRPLSITMVFGLLISTVLTLYVVPCMAYVLLEDAPNRIKKRAAGFLENAVTILFRVVNRSLRKPC